jgi:hypothetical protein
MISPPWKSTSHNNWENKVLQTADPRDQKFTAAMETLLHGGDFRNMNPGTQLTAITELIDSFTTTGPPPITTFNGNICSWLVETAKVVWKKIAEDPVVQEVDTEIGPLMIANLYIETPEVIHLDDKGLIASLSDWAGSVTLSRLRIAWPHTKATLTLLLQQGGFLVPRAIGVPLIKEEIAFIKPRSFFSQMKSGVNKLRGRIVQMRKNVTNLIRSPADDAELKKALKLTEDLDVFEMCSLLWETASISHASLKTSAELEELFENPIVKGLRNKWWNEAQQGALICRVIFAASLRGIRVDFTKIDSEKLTVMIDSAARTEIDRRKSWGGGKNPAGSGGNWGGAGWNNDNQRRPTIDDAQQPPEKRPYEPNPPRRDNPAWNQPLDMEEKVTASVQGS